MFDERAFIARVEAAGPDEFAQLLLRPTPEEERTLRVYFGEARYGRLHESALLRSRRRRGPADANVVVLHGIMGGELTATRGDAHDLIWARLLALAAGRASRLRLDDSGRAEHDTAFAVAATGIMKRSYGEILLELGHRWNVKAFWYDWRKDLELAAIDLSARLAAWFGAHPDKPVHLVAHSMGGLVARTFILNHRSTWEALQGRLIMLGTPNYGSFAIPQVITGLEGMVKKLALLDLSHDLSELLPIFNSFVGSYQMLPSPVRMKEIDWLYEAGSWPVQVPQRHLDRARQHHERLHVMHLAHLADDAPRMAYVAGYDQATFDGIKDRKPGDAQAYTATFDGDGRVPHALGLLDQVPTWYVAEGHGDLPSNRAVIAAVEDLLTTGTTQSLPTTRPKSRGAATAEQAKQELARQSEQELLHFTALSQRKRIRAVDQVPAEVGPLEREVEESITQGFLASPRGGAERAPRRAARPDRDTDRTPAHAPVTIQVHVVLGGIEHADDLNAEGAEPIDAIAVGHYLGVKPQYAEEALDIAISRALPRRDGADAAPPERQRLIAQYSERGTIRGELGQPFFLADPRAEAPAGRILALAGMGVPGRFGQPECVVLVRELLWALGRVGKRHLATVLIGAGAGNLSIDQAVAAWVSGLRRAVAQSNEDERERVQRITVVEIDPHRMGALCAAFAKQEAALDRELRDDPGADAPLRLEVTRSVDEEELVKRRKAWDEKRLDDRYERERKAMEERAIGAEEEPADDPSKDPIPTRITVGFDRDTYRFGAITDSASIPEREIAIDPSLVLQANELLVTADRHDDQASHGRFLGKLLVPEELRPKLGGSAPVVMMLDATTARIHWEMVAYNAWTDERGDDATGNGGGRSATASDFLGTSRGFTRQLRTTFAVPPEPPPPPRRVLKVLVVADPAADARLPGAEEEGAEVADLFESFNALYAGGDPQYRSSVEVTRLLGPGAATRVRVMQELVGQSYDVLHFAGHCFYDEKTPSRSGWIFSNGETLSARELQRVDRVPKFVFSNACESGITPDRADRRQAAMAPSFAEAFFARGVANFVCTAWPVDDAAARLFARTLYGALVGVRELEAGGGRYEATGRSAAMHEAMRRARLAAAADAFGVTTWGAYQHYGNPFLRLFDSARLRAQRTDAPKRRTSKTARRVAVPPGERLPSTLDEPRSVKGGEG